MSNAAICGRTGVADWAPSLAGDRLFRSWWAFYLRMRVSPGGAAALTKMKAEIDVRVGFRRSGCQVWYCIERRIGVCWSRRTPL